MILFLLVITVLDGVYTAEQATRGREIFTSACQKCHRYENLGGPEAQSLKGNRFIEAWREDTLDNLFAKMSATMPYDGPKLEAQEYTDIIAFILESNEYAAGTGELKPDQLADVLIVGKNGPQPLPSLATVKTVGCLAPGGMLTGAADPVRSRRDVATTGSLTIELRGDGLDANVGRKVQIVGVLNRRQPIDRINVTGIEVVAETCK